MEASQDWELNLKLKKLQKCGDISTSADGRFFGLGCGFCEAIFLQLASFADHIQTHHSKEVLALYADTFFKDTISILSKEFQPKNAAEFEVAFDSADLDPDSSAKDNIEKLVEDPLSEASKLERSKAFECEKKEIDDPSNGDNVVPKVNGEPADNDWKRDSQSSTEYDSMASSDFEWPTTEISQHLKGKEVKKYSKTGSNEHLMQVAEIYKQYPCLWDVNHEDSRSKIRRTEAQSKMLNEIEEKLNIKMNPRSLLGSISRLRRIYSMEKRNRLIAEELKIPFNPTHEFYNTLQFMDGSTGPYKCETCSECFLSRKKLSLHTRKHDVKSYKCDECPKECEKLSTLKRHKVYAHKYRAHKCNICSKRFFTMYKCREHMNLHLNIRNYVCEICGKDFVTKRSLDQHRKIHTEKKKYFTCAICGKHFIRSAAFYSHIKVRHGL